MQAERTEREYKLMKVFQKYPSEFSESLLNVANTSLTEKEIELIKCFRKDPERALNIIQKILSERDSNKETVTKTE